MVLRAVGADSLDFSRIATRRCRIGYRIHYRVRCAASLWWMVGQTRLSGAFLSALSYGTAKDRWHAVRLRRTVGVAARLEVDSR
jgi:hypothetical protein